MPLIDVPPIHAVTDSRILLNPGFPGHAAKVFQALGNKGAVHLRGPGLPARLLYSLGRQLVVMEEATGCRLVVNDRVDVARAVGCWGVQLGQRCLSAQDARLVIPDFHLGMSVHTKDEAREARMAGAEWFFAGHMFATPSHSGVAPRGTPLLADLAGFGVPVIAIGGVRPEHTDELRAAGAFGFAAIRGIWDAPDPGAAAKAYLQAS